ncbi:surface antigen (D15) [Chloroherpeton thalassium ATCC 35110]|uniref:Surface antigen (D15) n=1 Tax=Chloroherpeton thalassium (strain ATCC 35110 / GB-78) TaxID=517418 RepID=B3QU26_CHLT3|nr:surface antigen (D15) [Chloroherpeton thalassium]ACF12824.1 surface antigen (D15) [Chloroherpeton thalassium ATCC 35110]
MTRRFPIRELFYLFVFFCLRVICFENAYGEEEKIKREQFSRSDTRKALGQVIDTVLISGNFVTREMVIRSELLFHEAEPLTPTNLARSQQQVFNLQLFNSVVISAKTFSPNAKSSVAADKTEPCSLLGQQMSNTLNRKYTVVLITVFERWYLFPVPKFDLRGTSITRWIKKPTISNFNIGLSLQHRNFSGFGDLLATSFGLGYDPFVGISYTTPYFFGSNRTGFGFSAEYRKSSNVADGDTAGVVPSYSQRNIGLGVSISQRLSMFEYVGLSLDYKSLRVGKEIRQFYPMSTVSPDGNDEYVSVSAFYRYREIDFVQFPMDGFVFGLTLTQNGLPWISKNLNYFSGSLDVRLYQKLAGELSFAFRNYSILATNKPIPNHQRQYIGFGTQIRGYTSETFNGDNLQFNSLELRYPLLNMRTVKLNFISIDQFSIVQYGLFLTAFFDAGTIWYNNESAGPVKRINQFNFDDYKYGYGVGVIFIGGYRFTSRVDFSFNDQGDFEVVFEKGVSF